MKRWSATLIRARLLVALSATMAATGSCAFTTAASTRLHCPDEQIGVVPLFDGAEIVRGCGREALLACYGCAATADVARQAAFELACPVTSMRYARLDFYGATVGVSGCGGRAVYQYRSGLWSLDGTSLRGRSVP